MSQPVLLSDYRPRAGKVFFDRADLMRILSVYSRQVSRGLWRDYAIDHRSNMAVFSIYAAYLRLRPPIHWLSFMFMLAVMSAAMTLPFFVWESLSGFTFQPTLLNAGAILYVSIFPSILAFAAWNRGVELLGANRAGPFLHLIPIYTAVLGVPIIYLLQHTRRGFGFRAVRRPV